jgi:hypothetical protein
MQAHQRHKLHSKKQEGTEAQIEDAKWKIQHLIDSDFRFRFQSRNSIPISESEIKIQRAKTDAKYGKVAEPKVKLFYCFVIFLIDKVISTYKQ